MVQTPTKPLTLTEFLQIPETKPASEFIDGDIIQKPMPQGKHSTLQLDLGSSVNQVLKNKRIARAYSELRCTFGGRSIVPDISVFVWEHIPRDRDGKVSNLFEIAPDWTIGYGVGYYNDDYYDCDCDYRYCGADNNITYYPHWSDS